MKVEIYPNGQALVPVVVWQTSVIPAHRLYSDAVNPHRVNARQSLCDQLPTEFRTLVERLLGDLAVELAQVETATEDTRPSAALFPPLEPWPKPVDGTALYAALRAAILRYVVLPCPEAATALALWVLFTHTYDAFEFSPLLLVTGPTKACGKTRVCDVLRCLVARGLSCVGISDAALFRLIESRQPTVMVDEADNINWRERKELAMLLNSGFTRGAARIPRCVGEEHEVKEFSTWCPKVLAGKNARRVLLDTTVSRAVVIPMRKRLKSEVVARFREKKAAAELGPLRQQAVRWAADHTAALAEMEPAAYDQLDDRVEDAWTPLFAIADSIGVGAEARRAASVLSGGDAGASEDVGVELLRDVREVFRTQGDPKHLPTAEILSGLRDLPESQWGGWNDGKGIRDRDLSKHLQDFGLHSKNVKVREASGKERAPKGYSLSPILVALAPYVDSSRYSATCDVSKGVTPPNGSATGKESSGSEAAPKCGDLNESSGVAAGRAESEDPDLWAVTP